jgi:Secretion system C-terminal sorting domain
MKKQLFLLCFCLFYSNFSYSEGTKSSIKSKNNIITGVPTYSKFNINNISTYIYNNGESDIDLVGNSGFTFPKGSGKTAVFTSGFIWGGKVNDEIRVGGTTYRSGLLPGSIISDDIPEDPSLNHVRIYRVRSDYKTADLWEDANDMNMSYSEIYDQYEQDWGLWPAIYGAPYEDIDDDGIYNPLIDIPGIPGADQTIWFVANDLDPTSTHFLYGSPPMGIELQVTIWGYNRKDSFGDMMFRKYKIINKSSNNIEDMYVSMWSDPDVGGASDDFVGCDSSLSLAYSYNAFRNDAMYGKFPPAVGYTFLQGPIVNGELSDIGFSDGREYPGMKNLPMSSFYFFTREDPIYKDPNLGDYSGTVEFYNLLQGKVGLTGEDFINPITLQPTKFPLSGEPLTKDGWIDGILHEAADRRMGMASGPFNMAPADTQEVIVVEMAEFTDFPYNAHINNISGLKKKSLNIKGVLKNNFALDLHSTPITPLNEASSIMSSVLFIKKGINIQSFEWNLEKKPEGSNATINGIDFTKATLTPDLEGFYTISLTAVSDIGGSAIGRINIFASSNNAPTAEFTLSKTELIMDDAVTADGSNSSDIEGDPLEFDWSGSLWYDNNNLETTSFQPMSIGETSVLLDVSDGMFSSSAKKTINVSPKFDGITEKWNFLDTNYNYRSGSLFSKGDTVIGVPLESNIDSSKIVIYSKEVDGIEYIKEIPLPDCQTIETIKNDLLFVYDISNVSGGFFGIGKISIYRIGENWSLVKLLSNYFPSNDPWDDIYSINFYSDTAYVRSKNKMFKIDFLTDPSNPLVIDTFDWETEYANSGRTINWNGVILNYKDIYFYGRNQDQSNFLEVRSLVDFSLVKEINLPIKDQYIRLKINDNKLISSTADSVMIYEITNGYDLIFRSKLKYSLNLPWTNSEYVNLWTYFLDENIIVLEGSGIGSEVYNVSDMENPTHAGSWLNGQIWGSQLRKSGDNFSIDWVLNSLDYYSSGIELKDVTSVEDIHNIEIPSNYKLKQNYPNPFNPTTKISYSVPVKSQIELSVIDVLGREIVKLVNEVQDQGVYEASFDASNLPSGIYFYSLHAGEFTLTKKMMLLK